MRRRKRSREVEIFNFSFLDILACTIGLLIFIMVMVFILQSGSAVADVSSLIDRKLSEGSRLAMTAARDKQIADGLESQLDRLVAPNAPDLSPQRDAARATRDEARANYDAAQRSLTVAQAALDDMRLARDRSAADTLNRAKAELTAALGRQSQAQADLAAAEVPSNQPVILSFKRAPGTTQEPFDVLQVDCQAGGVVLFKSDQDGKITPLGRTDSPDLADENSDFQRRVAVHLHQSHPLVIFWVRPDGMETFDKAEHELPAGTPHGYEPAEADWIFHRDH